MASFRALLTYLFSLPQEEEKEKDEVDLKYFNYFQISSANVQIIYICTTLTSQIKGNPVHIYHISHWLKMLTRCTHCYQCVYLVKAVRISRYTLP